MVPKFFVFSTIFGFCIFTACLVIWKMPVCCIKSKLALRIRNLHCKSLTDFICHKLVSLTVYDFCLLSTVIAENSTGSVHHVQKTLTLSHISS